MKDFQGLVRFLRRRLFTYHTYMIIYLISCITIQELFLSINTDKFKSPAVTKKYRLATPEDENESMILSTTGNGILCTVLNQLSRIMKY